MKHPDEATLALHAGGDLGFWAQWRLKRHLSRCEQCRDEVAAFAAVREVVPELAEMPEIQWNRVAAEMRANIRLGLAAGECVRAGEPPLRDTRFFTGARTAVAMASVLALMVTGLMLERPAPPAPEDVLVVQATTGGIQVRKGGQALRLLHTGSHGAIYSSDAQGGMRAQYVNGETGYVTINQVSYAE
jgi:hypothetical protein